MTASERATWASMLQRALRTVREAQELQATGGEAESAEIAALERKAADYASMAAMWLGIETILELDINPARAR